MQWLKCVWVLRSVLVIKDAACPSLTVDIQSCPMFSTMEDEMGSVHSCA